MKKFLVIILAISLVLSIDSDYQDDIEADGYAESDKRSEFAKMAQDPHGHHNHEEELEHNSHDHSHHEHSHTHEHNEYHEHIEKPQEPQKNQKINLPDENGPFYLVFVNFALITEHYIAAAYKAIRSMTPINIIVFYIALFYLCLKLVLPERNRINLSYKITEENAQAEVMQMLEAKNKELQQTIASVKNSIKESSVDVKLDKGNSKIDNETSKKLDTILSEIARIQTTQHEFQSKVIESHRDLWIKLDKAKGPKISINEIPVVDSIEVSNPYDISKAYLDDKNAVNANLGYREETTSVIEPEKSERKQSDASFKKKKESFDEPIKKEIKSEISEELSFEPKSVSRENTDKINEKTEFGLGSSLKFVDIDEVKMPENTIDELEPKNEIPMPIKAPPPKIPAHIPMKGSNPIKKTPPVPVKAPTKAPAPSENRSKYTPPQVATNPFGLK
ncbi:unnamed protein product [Blepharisma stoltei]|uniref:Uncharacterized protein n=1 Tax=Blepharisma stoltei TaxID=1481888 RepID=A0AAU9JJ66_9CILI|nr:unnamed protein product [Blepharisma stoltei]